MSDAMEAVTGNDVPDNDVTERAAEVLLRVVGAFLAVCLLSVVGFVVTRWVLAADDDPNRLGTVDLGFMQDMLDHHAQALVIANTLLAQNPDGGASPYAREVLFFQGNEMTLMDEWLRNVGEGRLPADRASMSWMGMSTTVATMPGMQTPERVAELAAATGADADRLFFALMSEHHEGGAHMAEYAGIYAENPRTRNFASKMAYNQLVEITEYDLAVERLGLGQ